MDNDLITVLVPTFNDGEMLRASLKSLTLQSYKNLEVVISDDHSNETTVQVAKQFALTDERFKFFRNECNYGMTKNWNTALGRANGKYIMKLDGDDAYQAETVRSLWESLRRQKCQLGFCRTLECDDQLAPVSSYRGERALLLNKVEPLEEKVMAGSFWYNLAFDDYQLWHSNAFMVETSILRGMSGWDERFGCGADTDLFLRLLERDEPVVACPYTGVLYRQRSGSVSHKYRTTGKAELEGLTICLLSIQRHHANGGRLTRKLKQNWCRLWTNWSECHAKRRLQEPRSFAAAYPNSRIVSPPIMLRLRYALKVAMSHAIRGRS